MSYTVFPRISACALISALPRISVHPIGQNMKQVHPRISALSFYPISFFNSRGIQVAAAPKRIYGPPSLI